MISYFLDVIVQAYKMLIVILAFQVLMRVKRGKNQKEYIKWKKETLGI